MEKVEQQRNFINKLWNVSRYVVSSWELVAGGEEEKINAKDLTIADRWILTNLKLTIEMVTKKIDEFSFSQAGEIVINFIWNDLADWYIEASKFENGQSKKTVLTYVLRSVLKLCHPFIPFVTEVIWKKFNSSMLMVEKWPNEKEIFEIIGMNQSESAIFEKIKEVIVAIRNARSENKVEATKKVKAVIYGGKEWTQSLNSSSIFIMKLKTGIEELEIREKGEKISGAICAVVGDIEIYLVGAVDKEKEKARLEKEITNLEKFVSALNGKLSNQEFVGKAPEKVVELEKEKLAKAQTELSKLKEQLEKI